MIYDLKKKFIFIHIPRTGGMAITHSLSERCPDAIVDTFERRHWYAPRAFDELVEIRKNWDFLYRFAVMRNPWEIIASDYNLTKRDAESLTPASAAYIPHKWHKRLIRFANNPGFEEFVRREYLGEFKPVHGIKGFWKTWCWSYEDTNMGVHAIRFDKLKEEWPNVCERIGIEPYTLPILNEAPKENVFFSKDLQHSIARYFEFDISTFGYSVPTRLSMEFRL